MSVPISSLHLPVMLDRCLELVEPALQGESPVMIDATLGMGGHAQAVLQRYPDVRLIGIDRDPGALAKASQRLAEFADRFTACHATYDQIPQVLGDLQIQHAHAILMDLGVSSWQLDEAARGFAYSQDVFLDMRMDTTQGVTAAQVLNTYPVSDLARVIRSYGEEKYALAIAKAVARERESEPFTTSARLVELIRRCIPAAARKTGGNPAKRTFQALRIEVNRELAVLEAAVPAALSVLPLGGRLVVLSYQSLEDRLVKQAFAHGALDSTPTDLPVALESHAPELKLLTKGAEKATSEEVNVNPRSQSVRCRAVERVRPMRQGLTHQGLRSASAERRHEGRSRP